MRVVSGVIDGGERGANCSPGKCWYSASSRSGERFVERDTCLTV